MAYSIVSEGNCDRASGIEPVRLLYDKSLQETDQALNYYF
jgi:hypothetical protein